jgi:hypothetical protein
MCWAAQLAAVRQLAQQAYSDMSDVCDVKEHMLVRSILVKEECR